MDADGEASDASAPQPAAPSGVDSAAGGLAAGVRGMAAASEQATDGYAAGSEAEEQQQQQQA